VPVVIIGGGLTAIDTATEALAYYPLFSGREVPARYETLAQERGEAAVPTPGARRTPRSRPSFRSRDKLRAERAARGARGPAPQFAEADPRVGRRHHHLSPAPWSTRSYTLNHEEAKALEEGIGFAERITPEEVLLDQFGCARALRVSSKRRGRHQSGCAAARHVMPARTILVRRHAAQYLLGARAAARRDRRQIFQASTKAARRSRPSASPSRRPPCADERAARRPPISFFGEPASLLRRQRGEGRWRAPSRHPVVSLICSGSRVRHAALS